MLKRIKLAVLETADRIGLSSLLLESEWRRQRLLILCYHGISLDDEHDWDPALFMPATRLQQRFKTLREKKCALLPFDEAFRRLQEGSLPPRSVTVTFDDGTYDFKVQAMPVLRAFSVPVTLYFPTYYSYFNKPIYDLAVDYILWKARGRRLHLSEVSDSPFPLNDDRQRAFATGVLRRYAHEKNLTPEAKDLLLEQISAACDVDLESIRRRRILHLMTPEEVGALAREGVDVQLHTHRHRVYDDRTRFDSGIDDNRKGLVPVRSGTPDHFCYPGGVHLPEFVPWLQQKGIKTATTCNVGLASRKSSPWLLPRLVDTTALTPTEFAGWLSGVASILPRRPHASPRWMLVRGPLEDVPVSSES